MVHKVKNPPLRILTEQKGTNFYHKEIKNISVNKTNHEYNQYRAPT